MPKPQILSANRAKALGILRKLLCRLFSLNADLFHAALLEEGFAEHEAGLLVGPCMRTASSRRWMDKTEVCLPSRRNHSNLQRLWVSNLQRAFSQKGGEEMKQIREAYAHWESLGFAPPDELAEKWLKSR